MRPTQGMKRVEAYTAGNLRTSESNHGYEGFKHTEFYLIVKFCKRYFYHILNFHLHYNCQKTYGSNHCFKDYTKSDLSFRLHIAEETLITTFNKVQFFLKRRDERLKSNTSTRNDETKPTQH